MVWPGRIIDLYCEVPAFMVVFVSGVAMIDIEQLHGWYLVKIIAGTTSCLDQGVVRAPGNGASSRGPGRASPNR